MAKLAFYFNPRASGFSKHEWEKKFKKYLFRHDLNFYSPCSLNELKNSIQQNIVDKVEIVFLVGGDGTVNSVLPELVMSDFNIVVIPAGTANDLARELGLSQNILKTIKAFQYKTIRNVDVVDVNGNLFLTVGGIGSAYQVVSKVNALRQSCPKFKKVMSLASGHIYALFLVKEMLLNKFKLYPLRIECSEGNYSRDVEASMLYISNQEKLGGSFLVAPGTVNNDGKFNVSIFCHKNKMELAAVIASIRMGNYPLDDKDLIRFETDNVKISHLGKGPLPFFGDGEELGKASYFDIKILPKQLKFFCMKNEFKYEQSYSLQDVEKI